MYLADISAISAIGLLTVVRRGKTWWANTTSSKPTTDKSWGRLMPKSLAQLIAPDAIQSLAHTKAVKGTSRAMSSNKPIFPSSSE